MALEEVGWLDDVVVDAYDDQFVGLHNADSRSVLTVRLPLGRADPRGERSSIGLVR